MFQAKYVQKQTHTLCSVTFIPSNVVPVYEIMWKNTVQQDRPQMKIRRMRMRIACWIPKATDTPSIEYVILITSPRGTRWRRWLRHCATSRKVAGSIPDGVNVIFIDIILPVVLCPWG
jgi:hypothetical protein